MKPNKILVVCEEHLGEAIVDVLQFNSYANLFLAKSGERGIELIREHHPQLLIIDLQLPDMSGAQVLQWLRRSYNGTFPRVRSIVMSGHHEENSRREAVAAGCDAFLSKPFDLSDLINTVEYQLSLG